MFRFLLFLILLNLVFLNASLYYLSREMDKQVCVVDIQKIIEYFSSKKLSKEQASSLVKLARQKIEESKCEIVFVKGTVLKGKNLKDITEEVISYASKAFPSK
ncbi:MAG TPA: hypothetical protein EYG91_04105 [Aquifex aeolicus]|nr:hypothetical protein [Aquifex aeolicus]